MRDTEKRTAYAWECIQHDRATYQPRADDDPTRGVAGGIRELRVNGTHVLQRGSPLTDADSGTVYDLIPEMCRTLNKAPELVEALREIANHLASLTARLDGTEAKLYAADLNALNSRVYEARDLLAEIEGKPQ